MFRGIPMTFQTNDLQTPQGRRARGSRHATIPESSLSFKVKCGIPEERACSHKGWGMQDASPELEGATVPAGPEQAGEANTVCTIPFHL